MKRQFDSALYKRFALCANNKDEVAQTTIESWIVEKLEDIVKNLYVLELDYWNIPKQNWKQESLIIYKNYCWNLEEDLL